MASYQTRYPSFAFTSQEALRTPARPAASPGFAEGRALARAEAQQVAQFLIQAGRPELMGQLAGRSLEEVRAALSLQPAAQPESSGSLITALAAYARSMNKAQIDASWDAAFEAARQRL